MKVTKRLTVIKIAIKHIFPYNMSLHEGEREGEKKGGRDTGT